MSFIIRNNELRDRLEGIKNNKVEIKSPLLISSTTTLSVRQFIQILENGLIADLSGGDITLTTPTGADINASVPYQKYDQTYFRINTYVSSSPSINALTIVGNTGVLIANGGPITIPAQQAGQFSFTCYGISPITFVID